MEKEHWVKTNDISGLDICMSKVWTLINNNIIKINCDNVLYYCKTFIMGKAGLGYMGTVCIVFEFFL